MNKKTKIHIHILCEYECVRKTKWISKTNILMPKNLFQLVVVVVRMTQLLIECTI